MSQLADSRQERLREVLDKALEWPSERREAMVAVLCSGDSGLAADALSLLRALDRAGDLLEPPTSDVGRAAPLLTGLVAGSVHVGDRLGEGGMGVVYDGHDTRLDRRVAVKALPRALARDPHRRARLENEARALAALNHPNIAAIYGVEQTEHGPLLILEYIDGRTLAERLTSGPIPPDEALSIARGIARGLEAAHQAGVIHRDLKPSNIILPAAGGVKILDFGAAKSLRAGDPSSSAETRAGELVGTIAYMSPEQARGLPIDRRTDLWAFGCILYEMLTGRRAFAGAEVDALSAVVRGEPDWSALESGVGGNTRRLLERCLQKDPDLRLRDAGDARLELDSEDSVLPISPGRRRRPVVLASLAFVVGCAAALAARDLWPDRPAAPPARLVFDVALPDEAPLTGHVSGGSFCLSPDGGALAYVADGGVSSCLWMHRLDGATAAPIPGTQGATTPCFTPDGRELVWYDAERQRIVRAAVDGSGARVLAQEVLNGGYGLAVCPDGSVVTTGPHGQGLQRVPAAGGRPEPLGPDRPQQGNWMCAQPCVTPNGRFVLAACLRQRAGTGTTAIEAVDLRTQQRHLVLEDAQRPRIAGDWLLFNRGSALLRTRFDPSTARVFGQPQVVVESIGAEWPMGYARFDTTPGGLLAYLPSLRSNSPTSLAWYGIAGGPEVLYEAEATLDMPALSPDGRAAAFVSHAGATADLWLLDLERRVSTRITADAGVQFPVWAHDGTSLYYGTQDPDGHWAIEHVAANADSAPRRLYRAASPDCQMLPTQSLADGTLLLSMVIDARTNQTDLFQLFPGEHEPRRLLDTPADRVGARVSPDGRMIAYTSAETGRLEVYVQPWPALDRKVLVSTHGGLRPIWGTQPGTLYYRYRETIYKARIDELLRAVEAGPCLEGIPATRYDVAAQGDRFLLVHPAGGAEPQTRIRVMTDAAAVAGAAPQD